MYSGCAEFLPLPRLVRFRSETTLPKFSLLSVSAISTNFDIFSVDSSRRESRLSSTVLFDWR